MPALAFRLTIDGHRIVISGDQNLGSEGFVPFARGADLLVMPFAVPEDAGFARPTIQRLESGKGSMEARYAGYPLLADYLRRHAHEPVDQCRILFERMVPAWQSAGIWPTASGTTGLKRAGNRACRAVCVITSWARPCLPHRPSSERQES